MTGKTKKKDTPANEQITGPKYGNFVPTEAVRALLGRVKPETGSTIQGFINRCLEEYGPILLEDKSCVNKSAPLAARLKYLEDVVKAWVFNDLQERWEEDAAASKAHKEILRASGKKTWFKEENIEKIMATAKNNKRTCDTKSWEWQTLLRRRKDFMAKE
jgi:hypothetical protein